MNSVKNALSVAVAMLLCFTVLSRGDNEPPLGPGPGPSGCELTFDVRIDYGAGHYPTSVFSADLDRDSDQDLAVANIVSDNVSILVNNGDGTFATAVNYGAGDGPFSVFSADLDGDGDHDLAIAGLANVSILLNTCK